MRARVVKDVYLNSQSIVVKCRLTEDNPVAHWYILNNIKRYDRKVFQLQHFQN